MSKDAFKVTFSELSTFPFSTPEIMFEFPLFKTVGATRLI